MPVYVGIDLHSSNSYIGIIDQTHKRLFDKRLPNNVDVIGQALKPFKRRCAGVVVESTFNWYWLVDGLADMGYRMHLANPAAIVQYQGLKHTDDRSDAFWLAQMLQLGILKEGYIYPAKERPARDLLRRRLMYVRQRTAHILSLKSMVARHLGTDIATNKIKKLTANQAAGLFDPVHLKIAAKTAVGTIAFLTQQVRTIERQVLREVKIKPEFELLQTIPGIGNILGLTIMLEIGDINRFNSVGNYASYCRCVKSEKLSNKKKKGQNNRKNGNKYLAWVYVEAANFITRHCLKARRFYDKKRSAANTSVARKALANKIARASYHMLKNRTVFNEALMFR